MFFDATNIDTSSQFDAIPAGDYEAIVTGSAMKSTRDGSGQYLELTVEIQSGQFQGRRLWDRLNLQNRNPKAVEIGLINRNLRYEVQTQTGLHGEPVDMLSLHSFCRELGEDIGVHLRVYDMDGLRGAGV